MRIAPILLMLVAIPLSAHPLGNDSITHFSVLYVLPDRLEVDFLLDIAETQSVVIRRDEIDADGDLTDTREEQEAWCERKAVEFEPYLKATLNGQPLQLKSVEEAVDPRTGKRTPNSRVILKIPGNLGLPTYRLMIRYVAEYPAPLEPGRHEITYKDETYPDMMGLARIILERTTALTRLPDEFQAALADGALPEELRDFADAKGFPIDADAHLFELTPQESYEVLSDAHQYAILNQANTLRLYRLPRISFIPPRPDFWDEGIDPFLFEQYDPSNLPQERDATIRFKVVGPANAIHPSKDVPTSAEKPVEVAGSDNSESTSPPKQDLASEGETASSNLPLPDQTAQSSSSTGEQHDELVPTTPEEPRDTPDGGTYARADDLAEMPAYLDSFTSPANDPSKTQESYRQAGSIIAMLRGEGEYSGRSFLVVMALLTVLAFAWGAGHALMPGHAKTVVAAYLISQKGTYWHAILLAIVVTITHTALVVIVGLVIWATNPELGATLQNWLGITAGLMVAGMGVYLSYRAFTGRLAHHHHDHDHHHHDDDRPWWKKLFTHSHPHVPGHAHAHSHDHDHGHHHSHDHHHDHDHAHAHDHHHGHSHAHDHPTHTHVHEPAEAAALNTRTILVLGISGGIVPCPTATIIVLLGIGAGVVPGALYAVGVFSLGLALTLMTVGFLALSSRSIAARILHDAQHEGEPNRKGQWLMFQAIPTLSGIAVAILGLAIAANYVHVMNTGTRLIPWLNS